MVAVPPGATQAELDAEAVARASADSTHAALTTTAHGSIVAASDARLTDSRAPSGAAGGVLSGTYPNPGFASDMATQAELDAHDASLTAHVSLLRPFHTSGLYYSPPHRPVAGLAVKDVLYLLPVYLVAGSWDRIAIYIPTTAGSVGSVVRLGVYADNGSGFPGALLLDAGTVASTTTGIKEITIATTLGSGLFWTGAAAQVATTSPTPIAGQADVVRVLPMGQPAPSGSSGAGFYKASVTGAFPDPFGGATSDVIVTSVAPLVWLRRV